MAEPFNVAVIGAGSAGLVSAYICAVLRAKVALIERGKMGGDCLNYGCVPSKAIIRTARFIADMRRHEQLGIKAVNFEVDFGQIMDRVHDVIKKIEPHDSIERYEGLGVTCRKGEATIVDNTTVKVGGQTLKAKNIILAVGASPFVPKIKGLESISYRTSENLWEMRDLPKRFIVLGGGPIGSEMAQAFARLGSQVTQVEMGPRILPREDEDVSKIITERFQAEGIRLLTGAKATEIKENGGEKVLICQSGDSVTEVPFDDILIAVGRRANTDGFDWQKLGIKLNPNGTIATDPYLCANGSNVFAAGDCAGPYQFTHTASHQAYYCVVNALFKPFRQRADYRVVPWVTFTDPEVAQVGYNEQSAEAAGIPYDKSIYGVDDLDRAIAESEDHGLVKVLTKPGTDQIIGATIVSHNAGEMNTEFVAAMKHGFGLNKIMGTIHPYPTFSEANKFAASAWKNQRKPEGVLRWLEKFHTWRLPR